MPKVLFGFNLTRAWKGRIAILRGLGSLRRHKPKRKTGKTNKTRTKECLPSNSSLLRNLGKELIALSDPVGHTMCHIPSECCLTIGSGAPRQHSVWARAPIVLCEAHSRVSRGIRRRQLWVGASRASRNLCFLSRLRRARGLIVWG